MVKTTRTWQGYTFGRLLFFLGWTVLVEQLTGVIRSPQVSLAGLYNIVVGIIVPSIFLVAVAKGGPWAWYVILVVNTWGVLYAVGRLAYWGVYGLPTPWMRDHSLGGWSALALSLLLLILSFSYFYRRRVMFGARGHVRWLERRIPYLAGAKARRPYTFDGRPLISGWRLVLAIGAGLAFNVFVEVLRSLL